MAGASNALKKMKVLTILAGLLFFSVIPRVHGAAENGKGGSAPQPLTLKECIRIALESSPVAAASEKGVQAAQEAVGEARSPFYPEVGVLARYAHWQQRAFLPSGLSLPGRPTPTIVGPTEDWMTGVRMRYTLFDGGERRSLYQAAVALKGAAEEERARVRQDLILGVHQAYYGVAAAWETLKAAERNLIRAEDHLRLAEERKAAGAVSRADVLRVQVEKANAELARVRAESLLRTAKGNLNTLMGRSADTPLDLVLFQEKGRDGGLPDLDSALKEALGLRPEIRAAERRWEAGRVGVKAAKSTFIPKIRFEGSYGRRDTEIRLDDEEWSAAVSLEWPLFSGFFRHHRLARAQAEESKDKAEMRLAVLKVQQEVWNAHNKWRETFQALKTADWAVRQAEESLRLARERYVVGAGTVAELLDAEAALVRAQAAYIEAQWDHRLARAAFLRAVGRIEGEEGF